MWTGSGCYDFYRALGELNFDERYQFTPYWSQQITRLPEKIVTSFYIDKTAKRVMMILMNVAGGEDRTLTPDVDWAKLRLNPAKISVRNVMHNEPVRLLDNGQLEVPAPTFTYRMLAIEEVQ